MNRKVLILLSAPAILGLVVGRAQQPSNAGVDAQEHIRRLIASLPADSFWCNVLQHGAHGDGVRRGWMDGMQREGVKLSTFTFEFNWSDYGGHRVNWTVVEKQYFHDYDHHRPITDSAHLLRIKTSGLEGELEAEARVRLKTYIWVDRPSQKQGNGYAFVELADDEWLPVTLSQFLGSYEPGTTPLMRAALRGDVERIKQLLKKGADVNAASPDGDTALTWAAASDSPEAVKRLLKAGASIGAGVRGSDDALIAAVVADRPRNVDLLIKAGANPYSKNVDGETVLAIAIRQHYTQIVELLRQAGAHQ